MRAVLVVVALVVGLSVTPARACGCGVALLADVTRERALVIDRGDREEIVLSLDLQPEGAGQAAIVLPVPAEPEVEEVAGGDPLLYLDIATAPPVRASGGTDDAAAGAAPGGVDVIGRSIIGGYDVTRLNADDGGALDTWLDENGYTLPDGAEPILDEYADDGWSFVAIRLPEVATGTLKPLRVEFAADALVYPMKLSRLAETPIDLTLYVLADGARGADGLDVAYDGPVADLEPPVPPELEELFAGQDHLTKLTATGITEDLEIAGPAASAPSSDPGWGPPLAIALALAGAALLFFSRRSRPD